MAAYVRRGRPPRRLGTTPQRWTQPRRAAAASRSRHARRHQSPLLLQLPPWIHSFLLFFFLVFPKHAENTPLLDRFVAHTGAGFRRGAGRSGEGAGWL